MKFFALIFLFGLATASFHDILDDSDEEDFVLQAGHKKDKDDLQTEFGKKLKKTFDHILKEIKDAVEDGKGVSQALLDQARDLVHKLKKYGINVSDEAKDMADYLKTRFERWAEELIDILSDNSTEVHRADDKVREFGDKLRKALREILHEIKRAVEEGRHVSKELLDKAKDLIRRLKKYGMDVSEEVKDMLHYFNTRISKWAEELLDAFRGKRSVIDRMKNLIERFNLEEKVKDLRKLLDGEGDISSKFEQFLQEHFSRSKVLIRKLKDIFEEGKDRLKSCLDKILRRKETRSVIDRMREKLAELNLQEKVEKLRNMISEGVSNSKIKAFITEIIPEKAKVVRDFLLNAFEKGSERFKEILDRLFPRGSGF